MINDSNISMIFSEYIVYSLFIIVFEHLTSINSISICI